MIGMLQIITWLLCVYLVFKGVEIFQIGYTTNNEATKKNAMIIGAVALAASVLAAMIFFALIESQASSVGTMPRQ